LRAPLVSVLLNLGEIKVTLGWNGFALQLNHALRLACIDPPVVTLISLGWDEASFVTGKEMSSNQVVLDHHCTH
jgi:hypothetical protein